jgi:Uncharacterized protein conserved in bacteria
MRGENHEREDLSGWNLRGADLRGVRFAGADLSGADLTGASLRGANLCGADLSGAALGDADLTGVQTDAETRWPTGFNLEAHRAAYDAVVPPSQGSARGFEERVEEAFFEDGRLKRLPARNQKKLQVVLGKLAEAFEPEVRYPEREVNAILARFHPDYATLRRLLCDYRWMARNQGLYWRLRNVQGLKQTLEQVASGEG